jgi:hypothetical protein
VPVSNSLPQRPVTFQTTLSTGLPETFAEKGAASSALPTRAGRVTESILGWEESTVRVFRIVEQPKALQTVSSTTLGPGVEKERFGFRVVVLAGAVFGSGGFGVF